VERPESRIDEPCATTDDARDRGALSPQPEGAGVMVGLVLVSLPFAVIAAWSGRRWTLALPFVFWVGFAWLESLGILPGATSLGPAFLAGLFGAIFAGFGLAAHPRLRSHAA
jgi:hypothetical protein